MQRFLRIHTLWLTVLLLVGALCAPACAETKTPLNKAARGGVNFATGWLEIPNQMMEFRQERRPLWLLHGTVYGLGMGLTRTLMGVYDIITFPFSPYDRPVLDPETLIQPRTQPRHLEKS